MYILVSKFISANKCVRVCLRMCARVCSDILTFDLLSHSFPALSVSSSERVAFPSHRLPFALSMYHFPSSASGSPWQGFSSRNRRFFPPLHFADPLCSFPYAFAYIFRARKSISVSYSCFASGISYMKIQNSSCSVLYLF